MSKVKLLLDVSSDIRSLADNLHALADAMMENEPDETVSESTAVEKPSAVKIQLEDVRAVLAEKSQAGMTAQVRELIKKYGGTKLSDVDPAHYTDVLKEAEVLANG